MVLAETDLAVLDGLGELKAKRDVIQERLAQMEQRRTEVAAPIYLRVRADYEQQVRELESEEAPLKQTARALYAKLRAALDQVERESDEIRLNLAELEFRHSLGEFIDADYRVRKQTVEHKQAEKSEAQIQAKAMRERFVQALGEQELERAELPAAAPAPTFAAPTPARAESFVAPVLSPPAIPNEALTQPLAPVSPNANSIFNDLPPPSPYTPIPPPSLNSFAEPSRVSPQNGNLGGLEAFPPPLAERNAFAEAKSNSADKFDAAKPELKPEAPKRPANPDATVVFRPGKFLPANSEAGLAPTTLSLKPIAIGSDNSCDIRLALPGIQKQHASITLSRAGFMLRDLCGSGTVTVDGMVVSEQLLRDGDTVQIGPAKFTFKLA